MITSPGHGNLQPKPTFDEDKVLLFSLPTDEEEKNTATAILDYLNNIDPKESATEVNGDLNETMNVMYETYTGRYHPNLWILFYKAVETSKPDA